MPPGSERALSHPLRRERYWCSSPPAGGEAGSCGGDRWRSRSVGLDVDRGADLALAGVGRPTSVRGARSPSSIGVRATRWECRSTAHWLNWQCGLSMPRRVTRSAWLALERLPLVPSEFARAGHLLEGAGGHPGRHAAIEEMLVELALAGTASQLDRVCSAYRRVRRYEDDRADRRDAADGRRRGGPGGGSHGAGRRVDLARRRRHVRAARRDGPRRRRPDRGRAGLGGRAPPRCCMSQQRSRGSVTDPTDEPARPTRVEALVELARSYLAANSVVTERRTPAPGDARRRRRRHHQR